VWALISALTAIWRGGALLLRWLALIVAVLGTVPVRLAIRLDVNQRPTFQFVVYVYSVRLQFNGLIGQGGNILMQRGGGDRGVTVPVRALWHFSRHFIRGAELLALSADCRVGTGDAFSTALLSSALSTLGRAYAGRTGARIDVRPAYGKAFFAARLRCILFFRIGDIILAGVMAGYNHRLKKRKEGDANGAASD